MLPPPIQAMSPNLAAGCDPAIPQGIEELALGAGTARAILQQWTETKDDEGTVERRYTQIAQVWPLEDGSKLANIEEVIHTLRGLAVNYIKECALWARQLEARRVETEPKS